MVCNYALLDLKNVDNSRYCVITELPTGTALDQVDAAKPSSGEPAADVYPKDATVTMSHKLGGMVLPDIISNTWDLLIVHERVKKVIEEINQGPTEYLPLTICNHKNRVSSQDYFIVNPLGTYDAIDQSASKIEWCEGEVVVVEKYVLDPKKMEDVPDLFRPNEMPEDYFISARIGRRLRDLDPPASNRNFADAFNLEDS